MAKVLLLACAAVAVWAVLVWMKRVRKAKPSVPPPGPAVAEKMVSCWCGVHLPLSEARPSGSGYCCSKEHLRGPAS